jgi:hypothetical protein
MCELFEHRGKMVMKTYLATFAMLIISMCADASAPAMQRVQSPPPVAMAVRLSDPEAAAMDEALRGSRFHRDANAPAYLLIPEDFAAADAHMGNGDPKAERSVLSSERYAFALALPVIGGEAQHLFAVVGFRPVFPPIERDADRPPPKNPRPAELLRRLLTALLVMQVDDKPGDGKVPAVDPNCPGNIPDTAATIKKTRDRFGKETYKNSLGPGPKQGQWTNDPTNNRIAWGQTLPFYKIELGVGCEKIEGKEQWGVGLVFLDAQFRIVLGPGAKDRPAADGGATPGGLEGVLGHETKHGDMIGDAMNAALDAGGKWNGLDWKIREVLDEMTTKRFPTKDAAVAAMKKWQKILEERLAKLLQGAANNHTDKKGEMAPRSGTSEVLDKDKNKVADEMKLDDWIKEVKQLQTDGYKSLVDPGHLGKYP